MVNVDDEDLQAFDWHLFVSERYRFVFLTIPKVASTEWIRLFMRLEGAQDWREDPHYRGDRPFMSDLPAKECTRILNSTDWFKAVFFRDPVERLLSAYLDKFVYRKSYQVQLFGDDARDVPFADFLAFVIDPNRDPSSPRGLHRATNPHWRPQTLMGNFYKFREVFDFFGRFEQLHADSRALLEELGLWHDFGATGWGEDGQGELFGARHLAENRTGARDEIENYFSADQLRLARKAYRDDYDMLADRYGFRL